MLTIDFPGTLCTVGKPFTRWRIYIELFSLQSWLSSKQDILRLQVAMYYPQTIKTCKNAAIKHEQRTLARLKGREGSPASYTLNSMLCPGLRKEPIAVKVLNALTDLYCWVFLHARPGFHSRISKRTKTMRNNGGKFNLEQWSKGPKPLGCRYDIKWTNDIHDINDSQQVKSSCLACLLKDISCIRFGQRSLSFHQPQGTYQDSRTDQNPQKGSKIWVAGW